MVRSMTGYGRSELATDRWALTFEVKSVNSRYLDLKWRLPSILRGLESELEKVVREVGSRGRLEVSLNFRVLATGVLEASLNIPLAKAMIGQLSQLSDKLGVIYTPDLNRLLAVTGLWQDSAAEPDPALVADATACLRAALADWDQARAREGKALAADIAGRLTALNGWVAEIAALAPKVQEEKKTATAERIRQMLEKAGAELEEARILQETAVLADRLDVSEELTRLTTHLARLDKLLADGGEAGKRLDFLMQEIFREINTCGNKCQDAGISRLVVDFKAELEKCREQVQNIE
jgi:uncharacterized protein (TIGR00255 family)